eukprot:950003_1
MPVTEPESNELIESDNMPVTESDNKPMSESCNTQEIESDNKPVAESDNKPETKSNKKPGTESDNTPVNESVDKPVVDSENMSAIEQDSDQSTDQELKPVSDSENKLIEPELNKDLQSTENKSVQEPSDKPVTNSDKKPVERNLSSDFMTDWDKLRDEGPMYSRASVQELLYRQPSVEELTETFESLSGLGQKMKKTSRAVSFANDLVQTPTTVVAEVLSAPQPTKTPRISLNDLPDQLPIKVIARDSSAKIKMLGKTDKYPSRVSLMREISSSVDLTAPVVWDAHFTEGVPTVRQSVSLPPPTTTTTAKSRSRSLPAPNQSTNIPPAIKTGTKACSLPPPTSGTPKTPRKLVTFLPMPSPKNADQENFRIHELMRAQEKYASERNMKVNVIDEELLNPKESPDLAENFTPQNVGEIPVATPENRESMDAADEITFEIEATVEKKEQTDQRDPEAGNRVARSNKIDQILGPGNKSERPKTAEFDDELSATQLESFPIADTSDDECAIFEGGLKTRSNSIFSFRWRKRRGVLRKNMFEIYKEGREEPIFTASIQSLCHDQIELKMKNTSKPKFRIVTEGNRKVSFRVKDGNVCRKWVHELNQQVAQNKAMSRLKSQLSA